MKRKVEKKEREVERGGWKDEMKGRMKGKKNFYIGLSATQCILSMFLINSTQLMIVRLHPRLKIEQRIKRNKKNASRKNENRLKDENGV